MRKLTGVRTALAVSAILVGAWYSHAALAGAGERVQSQRAETAVSSSGRNSGGASGGDSRSADMSALAKRALSGDEKESAEAIATLRAMGRPGLDALLALEPENAKARREGKNAIVLSTDAKAVEAAAVLKRYCSAVDTVAGQRDAAISRLYWHTDFAQAKAEAHRENKPILSLRLLGKLTEEYSCANSRFFRTALYGNQEIAEYLRSTYVLHWESVRPAPKVTIDFGDGRKLKRTITGNSVHYVLDSHGLVVDVLPGLYGPQAFLREIKQSSALVARLRGAEQTVVGIDGRIANAHRQALAKTLDAWNEELKSTGGTAVAMSDTFESNLDVLDKRTDDRAWRAIAALHTGDAKLDKASRDMVRREHPDAWNAGRMAIGKSVAEDPTLRLIRNFERNMAVDTVRNEYLLRSRIRFMLVKDTRLVGDIAKLNDRVYAEVFLTPRNDPWLGLATEDEYSGLTNDGKVTLTDPR